jgi:histidinol dehydrogenase
MRVLQGFAASRAAIEASNAARAFTASPELEAQVRDICEAVRHHGDDALLDFCRKFDSPTLSLDGLRVSQDEIEAAWAELPSEARTALERAAANIEAFHRAQAPRDFFTTSAEGSFLGNRWTPIERVGLYAPNGKAAYPSTVLMLAVPARVAGVREMVLATPASRDGKAHPVILAAAKIAGVTEIYKMGGAAAMGAFAYGTATVPKVDKVVGPGSIYLTLAKKHLFGVVGVDGLYGPSEVAVIADESQDIALMAPQMAADLLAQAEHGSDSFVTFLSPSAGLCDAVLHELERQAEASPRAKLAAQSLAESFVCHVATMDEACALCDLVAAEHVEIWSDNALAWSQKISNAGAIFLNTPVPLGDYILGPSHTLPTGATARFSSGVGVDTFLKRTTLVSAPKAAIAALADDLEAIAHLEDLPGHAAATRRAAL